MKPGNHTLEVDIIIPTFNRAHSIRTAIEAAFNQTWANKRVTVVDDGSVDHTESVVATYFGRPDFQYLRLRRNVGTANAKNAGLLLTGGGAVTFHDSDDIPHPDKVLHQARALIDAGNFSDPCLDWAACGRSVGQRLTVSAVLTHHELILPEGRRESIRRTLSLVDDIFPNLQVGSTVAGDWTHVNSGLFRDEVFHRLGGFAHSIEEDREFRNRLILGGEIVRVIPELLLTKIETDDSLTRSNATGYGSTRRRIDRQALWEKVHKWRITGVVESVEVDLPHLQVDLVSNPRALRRRDMPMTAETQVTVQALIDQTHARDRDRLCNPPESEVTS